MSRLLEYQPPPPAGADLGVDRLYEERTGCALTVTGRWLDVMNPCPADLDIRDIAAGLAKTCRYAGQIPNGTFYSVAQHAVLVSRYFEWPYARMAALLHDSEEAFLGDMVSPFKKNFPELIAVGNRLRVAILDKFGVCFNPEDGLTEAIHAADDKVYRRERLSFWGGEIDEFHEIRPWTAITAECEFLREFDQINQEIERMKDGR